MGLGGVAFITLLERKILGLSQIRLGPNKVSFVGLLQPVIDGLKLLIKSLFLITKRQLFLIWLGPVILIFLFLLVWVWIIPWHGALLSRKYSSILYFSMLGISAYAVILTGWRSTRSFSKLGSVRSILQSLSFEVTLILIFILVIVLFNTFIIKTEVKIIVEVLTTWVILWILVSLIETNRAPFDLLEGERELIRGFNIELGSLSFVYIFLREYGIIIVISLIFSVGILGVVNIILISLFSVEVILLRRCFPRIRYDIIIEIIWQSILLIRLRMFLILSVFLKN